MRSRARRPLGVTVTREMMSVSMRGDAGCARGMVQATLESGAASARGGGNGEESVRGFAVKSRARRLGGCAPGDVTAAGLWPAVSISRR